MTGRMRHLAARSLLLAAGLTAFWASTATADVWSNMDNWFVDTSYDAYPSQFTISSGGPHPAQFRWLDSPNTSTNVFAASCADNAQIGSTRTYGVGDTSYQTFFTGSSGTCFKLWGQTTSGSMSDHDGRVSR